MPAGVAHSRNQVHGKWELVRGCCGESCTGSSSIGGLAKLTAVSHASALQPTPIQMCKLIQTLMGGCVLAAVTVWQMLKTAWQKVTQYVSIVSCKLNMLGMFVSWCDGMYCICGITLTVCSNKHLQPYSGPYSSIYYPQTAWYMQDMQCM